MLKNHNCFKLVKYPTTIKNESFSDFPISSHNTNRLLTFIFILLTLYILKFKFYRVVRRLKCVLR